MFKNLMESDFRADLEKDPDIVLIDVRTLDEYRMAYIPNTVHIDIFRPDFVQEIQKLDRDKKYYIYCRSGARSANACQMMAQMGFKDLTNLFGGILDWRGQLLTLA